MRRSSGGHGHTTNSDPGVHLLTDSDLFCHYPVMFEADPTAAVDSAHTAIVQAEKLLKVGRNGLGRDRPADFWEVKAVHPLAALLFAASPMGNGLGIKWLQSAVENIDTEDVLNPGWAQAAVQCTIAAWPLGHSVVTTLTADPRQRDAIVAAVRAAIAGPEAQEARRCG